MLTGLIFLLCEPARFPDKGFASMEVIPNLRHQIDLPRGPESWGYGDYDQGPPANHFVDHGYESIPRYRDTSYYNLPKSVTIRCVNFMVFLGLSAAWSSSLAATASPFELVPSTFSSGAFSSSITS
ncbi:hypothetical protein TCAL_17394 [Tigriopus californicus]|uniref:Uncharacterized protein n=1 Tax=Tigriopus californicus TaxID=6832 RepID=A0A553NG16_TIGCA|nr:hypothetical protein TCAL_17394 [Tigriopus californicus]